MITPTQMRAARAMLDVPQGHVAQHLGIAANTLSKIESGQSDISMSRLIDIQKFYEREGIAFTENDGVAFKSSGVETYEGRSGFGDFIDDVYNTVKDNGGHIFVSNVKEEQFNKWGKDYFNDHSSRMSKVENLEFKIIVEQGDENLTASYAAYKTLSSDQFGALPLYIYGDKTALITFGDDNVTIFVINHKAVSCYFRDRFLSLWENANDV